MKKSQFLFTLTISLIFFLWKYKKKNENNLYEPLIPCYPIFNNSLQYYAKINGQVYPKSLPLILNKSINFSCLNSYSRDKSTKTILFWNNFFNLGYSRYGNGKIEPFKKMGCPVVNCEITNNKSLLNSSDFVIVHMYNPLNITPIPSFRPPFQRWIFLVYESPFYSFQEYSKYNSMFNLTATYRMNSNFYTNYYSYAQMIWEKNHSFNNDWNYLSGKSKMAFALIRNCYSKFRLNYIQLLKKHIEVDIFGYCGKPCPYSDCRAILSTQYRFYFAFENNFCEEYITEKFFDTLKFDIIPVVMGSGPYDYYVSLFVSY